MINQCCIKFKQEATPALDAALLPFLRKCHTLMPSAENGEIAPHLETERLSVKKLSYVVLQHVVTHRATAVLLTPRNTPNIEEVLKIMSGGALDVEEPVIKKTCIQFFRELIDQWGPQVNGANGFERSYIRYVYESFCPGMLKCFLSPSFDETDAMQSRSINEFAQLLFSLKTSRGADEFTQCVIVGCLQKIGCPPHVLDAFQTASEAKQVELCLKETIKVLKINRGAAV
jgi:exportin-T